MPGEKNLDWKKLRFPSAIQSSFSGSNLVPFYIKFTAVAYTNKTFLRNNAPTEGDTLADITVPMPKVIESNSVINYSADTEDRGFDPTWGGAAESILTGFGLFSGAADRMGVSGILGKRPMDERANIFQGANMREHQYDWLFVPKEKGDGEIIANIAKAFQTMAFPGRSGWETRSKVIHPPVWWITVIDTRKSGTQRFRWDLGPLPSVIKDVKVQTAGAAGGIYIHGKHNDSYPAATKISVSFSELEPAINGGQGLVSRSQLIGGDRGNDGV